MLRIDHNIRAALKRRTAPDTPTADGSTAVSDAPRKAGVPELTTERWKRRVEADARRRLQRSIRGVGSAR